MIRLLVILLLVCSQPLLRAAGRTQSVSFSAGEDTLTGLLAVPDREGRHPVIIFIPGDGPVTKEAFLNPGSDLNNRVHQSVGDWNRFLQLGFACFAWDKPGLGQSTGNWQDDTTVDRAREVSAAIKLLQSRDNIDPAHIGLWGISQAGWVMPEVAAEQAGVAFIVAVSCPGQTIVEESGFLVEQQLRAKGIDATRAGEARDLYLRKWEMMRSGIPFVAMTKYITQNRVLLGDANHEWLRPWTLEEFDSFRKDPAKLESFFYNPLGHLSSIKIPVLAVFGAKDTQVNPGKGAAAYRAALARAKNERILVREFPQADHLMGAAKTGSLAEITSRSQFVAIPEYWATIDSFLGQNFPDLLQRERKVFRSTDARAGNVALRFNFHDEQSINYELNLVSLARRTVTHFTKLFGGPPLDEAGQPIKEIVFHVRYGDLNGEADPGRIDLTIGPQKVFGYLTWRNLVVHELMHLWNAETFRYEDYHEQWFNEGATEYMAIKTAVKLGFHPKQEGPFLIVRCWGNYNGARGIGEISLREAGHPDRKKGYYFLIYHGGLTACTVLDYEIRRLTKNQKSFEDLLRYLYQNHNRTDRRYNVLSILKGLKEITGRDFTDFFRRHIHGKEIIPIGRYITRMEIEAMRTGQAEKIPSPDREILEAIFEHSRGR
ncbi:MAG: alpha/beta fold hydrolase [Limisphaerales bacterium]